MRTWRLALVGAAGLVAAAAATVLAVALNVATGGTARWFPAMERYPLWWTAGATVAVAGAGLLVWRVQGWYERELATIGSATRLARPGIVSGLSVVPQGAVRAAEADLRLLGVHRAISVPGVSDQTLPEYVLRDVDIARPGVRAAVAAAAERGGLVVLVGGSSVGKTRCAAQAVKALVPDWWLVHPAGSADIAALAQPPVPARMVVWLDELQRYLDDGHGLDAAVIRALLAGPGPVVIIGTLWPEYYTAYMAVPVPFEVDAHERQRQVLGLASSVIRIAPEFSPAEQDRAWAAAARDRRLRVALETSGYGLTQTLAAAPQLVARWENAGPYARAVLAAALDIARLGGLAPLTAHVLRAAAPGYCTSRERAEAPASWFEQALTYATASVDGVAAMLEPAGTSMGQIVGYSVADYLLQNAARARYSSQVPASTWDAILTHVKDPADAARLADSADRRLLYRYATPLHQRAADAGDRRSAERLARRLAARGEVDELRARAGSGDELAARALADWLADHGDIDELRTRADTGEQSAADRLARWLAKHDDTDELRARADSGDEHAARALAERGGIDEVRARADAGDRHSAARLAGWLEARGEVDELRARAGSADEHATSALADWLADRGDIDGLRARTYSGDKYAAMYLGKNESIDELRVRADTGDWRAAALLAGWLAAHDDIDALQARAASGDESAYWKLSPLLAKRAAERADTAELRARADTGDWAASAWLALLLAEHGDIDELRNRVSSGDREAGAQIAKVLLRQGRDEEANQVHQFGLNPDGSTATR